MTIVALRIFCLLVLVSGSVFSQTHSDPLGSEQERFAAQIQRDSLKLTELLHSDLRYIHSNGITESKAGFIKSIQTKKIVYESLEPLAEPVLRQPAKDIAVIDGKLHAKGRLNGNPFDIQLAYTSVYALINHKWLLYAWQSAKMP